MNMATLLIALILGIVLLRIVSVWQQYYAKKALNPYYTTLIKYEQQLKTWCKENNIEFNENLSRKILNEETILVNGCSGYLWFDNKNLFFCPNVFRCGNPINIKENIMFIAYNNIKYYTKDGTVSYTSKTTNNGKNISISGALIGGAIAGGIGAIIGSRKDANKFETTTVKHDEVRTYIYYEDNNNIKILDIKGKNFYLLLFHTMPEKEYNYLSNKHNI